MSVRLGIVGGGAVGVATAIMASKTLQRSDHPITIDVFEQDAPFRGRAFNTHSRGMMLNTPVGVTSIEYEGDGSFIEYLRRQESTIVQPSDIVPRDAAMRYFQHEFTKASRKNVTCNMIRKEVTSIVRGADSTLVLRCADEQNVYDAIVLATGRAFRPSPVTVPGAEMIEPYPAHRLSRIDPAAAVLVVGSSLTAVDVIRHLDGMGHTGPIHVYSTSGLFPAVRKTLAFDPHYRPLLYRLLELGSRRASGGGICKEIEGVIIEYLVDAGMEISEFMVRSGDDGRDRLIRDIALCEERRNAWEPVFFDLVEGLDRLVPQFSEPEKEQFWRGMSWMNRLAGSMPLSTAKILQQKFESGQIEMVDGDCLVGQRMQYDFAINATGLVCADSNPLLKAMSEAGLLRFNCMGGVAVDVSTCRASSVLPLYANGLAMHGEVFSTPGFFASVSRARVIARDLRQVLGAAARDFAPLSDLRTAV